MKVLALVGMAMAAMLVMLGGIMVTKTIFPREAAFVSAPPAPQENRAPERKKVILKRSQSRTSHAVRRIQVPKIQNIQTPDVQISLPSGLGGEGAGGITFSHVSVGKLEKLAVDLPDFSMFGLKGSSDRVLICFDASAATMTDDMGALPAFEIVKSEITALVKGLSPAVLFNVMAFDRGNSAMFSRGLVPAGGENKSALEKWLEPINADETRYGIDIWNLQDHFRDRLYEHRFPTLKHASRREISTPYGRNMLGVVDAGGLSVWRMYPVVDLYKVYQAALEQGAGVIYLITSDWGLPGEIMKPLSESDERKMIENTNRAVESFIRGGGKLVSSEESERAQSAATEEGRLAILKENEARAAKGLPPMVADPWGYAIKTGIAEKYGCFKNKTWESFTPKFKYKKYTQSELAAFYEPILKEVYDKKGVKRPILNMIIMLPKDNDIAAKWRKEKMGATSSWAAANQKGRVRVIRGGKPVAEYDPK